MTAPTTRPTTSAAVGGKNRDRAGDRAIYGLDGLTLGERIRRARRRLGRQAQDVAWSAEVRAEEVSRWETDRCVPSLYAFAALAEALGLCMHQLYWGEERCPCDPGK